MQPSDQNKIQLTTEVEIQAFLAEKLALTLRTTPDKINIHDDLAIYGIDSLDAMTIMGKLSEQCGVSIDFDVLWDYPNIEAVSKFVVKKIRDNA